MDHNVEPKPNDEDKHSTTLGHAMPVRTHAFTARGALQSQSSHQLGSEGEPGSLCSLHGSLASGTVLTCAAASYLALLSCAAGTLWLLCRLPCRLRYVAFRKFW